MAGPLIIMVDSILQGNRQKKGKHLIANICSIGGSDGKEPACNAGDLVRSLGGEDLLGEGMATHSSILAWRTTIDRGAWWATAHGVAKNQT